VADKFIQEKRHWIFRSYHSLRRKKEKSFEIKFEDGASVLFLGEWYVLRIKVDAGSRSRVELLDDEMVVKVPSNSFVKSVVTRFYRSKAREVIADTVSHYAEKLDLSYQKISIRDQKTRWGSCSSAGNLNFSYRLVMAPLKVIDYVIVHELCHLKEMNHSKKFWALVEKALPDYKEKKKWLKENGSGLSVL
jgi:predicted metal-dependent hydrolase